MATNIPSDHGKAPKAKQEWKSRVRFVLIAFPLMVALGIYEDHRDELYEDRYFTSLDLELTGVVQYVDAPSSSNNFGIVGVEVLSTNKLHVDQRDSLQYYYCLVKNGKAELYQSAVSSIRKGDTLKVDAPNRLLSIRHTNGKEPDTTSLELYDNDFFWKYVKKHYQKF